MISKQSSNRIESKRKITILRKRKTECCILVSKDYATVFSFSMRHVSPLLLLPKTLTMKENFAELDVFR